MTRFPELPNVGEHKVYTCQITPACFLPVQIGQQKEVMLVDSSCTQSILIREVMERIPQYCRTPTTPVCDTGILADACRISLDESTTVIFKLGSRKVQHQFLIAELSNHILQEVDFLKKYQCHIDFKNCQLSIQEGWIQCCNADREPLQVSVQRKRLTATPADSELMMNARMNCV